jgi:hypothetical protein
MLDAQMRSGSLSRRYISIVFGVSTNDCSVRFRLAAAGFGFATFTDGSGESTSIGDPPSSPSRAARAAFS